MTARSNLLQRETSQNINAMTLWHGVVFDHSRGGGTQGK